MSEHRHADTDRISDPRFLHHVLHPHDLGTLTNADGSATGVGTCGDAVTVQIRVENERIEDLRTHPDGCSYTVACASALSCIAKQLPLEAALEITPESLSEMLGGLPEDHFHCARLAINTLGEAIADYYRKLWGSPVSSQEKAIAKHSSPVMSRKKE